MKIPGGPGYMVLFFFLHKNMCNEYWIIITNQRMSVRKRGKE